MPFLPELKSVYSVKRFVNGSTLKKQCASSEGVSLKFRFTHQVTISIKDPEICIDQKFVRYSV